eukprot:813006_1
MPGSTTQPQFNDQQIQNMNPGTPAQNSALKNSIIQKPSQKSQTAPQQEYEANEIIDDTDLHYFGNDEPEITSGDDSQGINTVQVHREIVSSENIQYMGLTAEEEKQALEVLQGKYE